MVKINNPAPKINSNGIQTDNSEKERPSSPSSGIDDKVEEGKEKKTNSCCKHGIRNGTDVLYNRIYSR